MKINSLDRYVLYKTLLVMKLTVLLLMFFTLNAFSSVFSQKQKVTINLKNVTLEQAIEQIEKESGYEFFYHNDRIDITKKVTVVLREATIETVLGKILDSSSVDFRIIENSIILTDPRQTYELPTQQQQKLTIKGVVSDATGEPLPGVTVVEQGTSNGTITGVDGTYSLTVMGSDVVLKYSFIGFKEQYITVAGRKTINLTLIEETTGLDEVVVVGFGVQKKTNLTGAVSSIQADEIVANRPITNVFSGLQGVVPGLQLTTQSGRPGATELGLNIRGATSLNGGSPLILLDNVPVSTEDINPSDVESVVVLKDASASAIYGSRAAFGVILITTKKAKKNEPIRFDYSSTFSFSEPTDLPEKASVYDFVKALDDFGVDSYWSGQNISTWLDYLEEFHNNPSLYPEGYVEEADGNRYPLATQDGVGAYYGENGFTQIHNFSFSGGSERSSYRVSMGYSDQDGIIVTDNDSYKKYNLKSYLRTDITSKLSLSADLAYRNSTLKTPIGGYNKVIKGSAWVPYEGDYEVDGKIYPLDTPLNNEYLNPAPVTKRNNFRMQGNAIFKPIKDWTVNAEYTFETKFSNYTEQNNQVQTVNPETFVLNGVNPEETYYYLSDGHSTYNALNLYTQYTRRIKDHDLTLMLGYNNEDFSSDSKWLQGKDLISTDNPSIDGAKGIIEGGDAYSEWAVQGFYGRFNYNYKEKYLLEVSARYDGSSRFPRGSRYVFFPSVSAGWNLKNESFLQDIDAISLLKLRVSYGTIGNQSIANYAAYPTMNPYEAGWLNLETGLPYTTLNTPALISSDFTWEEVRSKNIGLDFRTLRGRLSTSFDAFIRETSGMLTAGEQLPSVLGTGAPRQNAADLKSAGWEVEVKWQDRIGQLSYNIGFSLTDSQGEITKFKNEAGLISNYYVGQKLGEIWGYVTDGYYTVDDFVEGTLDENLMGGQLKEGIPYFKGKSQNPGDIKYKDLDGDGVIFSGDGTLEPEYDENGNIVPNTGPGDRKVIGNSTRRYQFGIFGNLAYKNFDFSFVLNGVGKRDLWMNNNVRFGYTDRYSPIFTEQLDYWTVDNSNAKYPRNYEDGGNNYANSTRVQTKYLLNGAYLNIQNITLGYSLPASLLKKLKISRLRVYASVENLHNFNNWPEGINTELSIQSAGNVGANYPLLRGYNFGLNLSF